MLSNWSIRTKLLIGLSLLLVIVSTLSWGGIHGLYAYRSLVRSLSRRVQELPKANDFSQSVSNLRVEFSESRQVTDLQAWGDSNSAMHKLAREEFNLQLETVELNFTRYCKQLSDNPDRTGRISDSHQEWQTVRQIEAALNRIRDANRDQDWLLDHGKVGRLHHDLETLQVLASKLPNFLYQNIGEFTEDARGQYRTLIILSWITSVCGAALFLVFIRLGYQWVFRPLRVLVEGSRRVADGQFNHRIRLRTDDEMSELANAMNDMTARFQATRDDLDRQVKERTKQVVRSEQLASVGFLAAGVAHEINNPLASIAMCAESLEGRMQGLLDDEHPDIKVFQNYLRMIQQEAFRCKEITEKLLDFSRIGEVKRQPADLRELVRGVIDMLSHLGKYQDKHIEMVDGESVIASVNAPELKQVVLNLVTNALDSLDAGGTVTVEVTERNGQAEMVFTDTGCGMTAEVQRHLFEPFFTRRRGGQGTGLGLSITHRIVEDHCGSIDVHSDGPGHGSWFCVRLPLAAQGKEKQHRYQAA